MTRSAIPGHFPTFAAWFRKLLLLIRALLLLIRAMCRVGVWLSPRVALVLVLVMGCQLVWIVLTPGRTDRVMVLPTITRQTLVGFDSIRSKPPPRLRGNCFSVSPKARWGGSLVGSRSTPWQVCNMHAENFSEIVQRLKLQAVEVQLLDEGRCIITDPRISRDWLLEKPCPTCFRESACEDILMRYPERFRSPSRP
jgi:hypothetical protein